ncbi:MAG TPA: TetR family transcriptional regulator, partial [Candidatus Rifleibacterium sp.]|nr:TetR family transcriptional regulator [Candidatus Rifleibacterium sp.]
NGATSCARAHHALAKEVDDDIFDNIVTVCGGNIELARRIEPFAHLLRTDAWDDFIFYPANSFAVTLGTDRRETGTHYTPKSLTESIVETTLEPVVYIGPAEGKPRDKWQLKTSAELLNLKICDPAMGSGAFLVQVCRWLSERLVETWGKEASQGKYITVDGIALDALGNAEPMPDSIDERLLIARRLIAEKCLYGVDLNPLAVELAKLSIWLITLAKGRPFGFLDHNLKSGDSLVGIHRLEQLYCFDLHADEKTPKKLFADKMDLVVNEALELRKKLRETLIRDIQDIEYMEQLDQEARQKLEHIEHIADAMIGAAMASDGNQRALDNAMDKLSTWVVDYIGGDNETGRRIISEARKSLSIDLLAGKPTRKPFHWALEFPEVFERGGFDGIVGNPPFMGGRKISSNFGDVYQNFIKETTFANKKGSLNLVLYFVKKAITLIKPLRAVGLISTDSIKESDNREIGLSDILNCSVIYNAISSIPWPGKAGVYISVLNLFSGCWRGKYHLDGKQVHAISSSLEPGNDLPDPFQLFRNKGLCSDGVKVQGIGFVIDEIEAKMIIERDSRNKDVITRYIVGNDINTNPDYLSDRFVINFWDHDQEYCAAYSIPWAILTERVKPYRDGLTRQVHETCFWKFWDRREEFFNRVKKKTRVLVSSKLSKYFCVVFGNPEFIYSEKVKVFDFSEYDDFCVLQSSFHIIWALHLGSSTGETPAYVGSLCFDTFPFPSSYKSEQLKINGKKYYQLRDDIIRENQEGLTKTYNRFHNAEELAENIQYLRLLQIELDKAVASSYGWSDIDLGHGFHETKQGTRFTISEEARREVLRRLLKLNHERHEEEFAQTLHDKKKAKKTSASSKKKIAPDKGAGNMDLFSFMNVSQNGKK